MSVEEISEYEQILLNKVPIDGKSVGCPALLSELGWEDSLFESTYDKLIEQGVLRKGPGRGGTLLRTDAHIELSIEEKDLYEPMERVIRDRWAKNAGFDNNYFVVKTIALQGRRITGGKWSRPDILAVAMTTYPYVPPGKYLDVITFEVKPPDSIDITAVYEALSHYRAAHISYVLLHVPDSMENALKDTLSDLSEEAKRQGIGVIVAADPADWDTWEECVEPVRHEPDPKQLNKFLENQAKAEVGPAGEDTIKDKIIRWFR